MNVNYFIASAWRGEPQRREGREDRKGFRFFVFMVDHKAVIIDMVDNLKLTFAKIKGKIVGTIGDIGSGDG